MDDAPAPVFEEPWHAQVFAITVALNEAGVFQWTDWANRFGATLKQHGLTRDLNGGSDYFHAWIETLEDFLADQKIDSARSARENSTLLTIVFVRRCVTIFT